MPYPQNCLSSGALTFEGAGTGVYIGSCQLMGVSATIGPSTTTTSGSVTLYDNNTGSVGGEGKVIACLNLGWVTDTGAFLSDQIIFRKPIIVDSGIWLLTSGLTSAIVYYSPVRNL